GGLNADCSRRDGGGCGFNVWQNFRYGFFTNGWISIFYCRDGEFRTAAKFNTKIETPAKCGNATGYNQKDQCNDKPGFPFLDKRVGFFARIEFVTPGC